MIEITHHWHRLHPEGLIGGVVWRDGRRRGLRGGTHTQQLILAILRLQQQVPALCPLQALQRLQRDRLLKQSDGTTVALRSRVCSNTTCFYRA